MDYVKLCFTYKIFEDFSGTLSLLISNIFPLWSENVFYDLNSFECIENPSVAQHMGYILWTFHVYLKSLYILQLQIEYSINSI